MAATLVYRGAQVFIGLKHGGRNWSAAGHSVCCSGWTCLPARKTTSPKTRSKIRFIKGSITDIEVVAQMPCMTVEYVLHLAARNHPSRASVKDPIETKQDQH